MMATESKQLKPFNLSKVISFILLLFFAIIFIIPLLWIIISSFKVDMEVYQAGGFMFFPKTWTIENYQEILSPGNKQLPVYNWFINSFFISVTHSVLAVLITSSSAYAYAKLKFRGKNVIFMGMLFMSTFPAITNIIPMYRLMLEFKWLNTPWALIVPGLAGVMNIFLIRQFIYGIPNSLLEAARIDGANEFRIYARLILPLSKPILTVVALFSFTGNWNDFLWPSIAINNIDRLTLTAGLQLAKGVYGNQVARMSTIATIAIIPMLLLYLFTEKYFASGLSISSGVKE